MAFFKKTRWLWRGLCFAGLLIAIEGIVNVNPIETWIGGILCGAGASAGWAD